MDVSWVQEQVRRGQVSFHSMFMVVVWEDVG